VVSGQAVVVGNERPVALRAACLGQAEDGRTRWARALAGDGLRSLAGMSREIWVYVGLKLLVLVFSSRGSLGGNLASGDCDARRATAGGGRVR
jgi:hypothetical protein